MKRNHELVDLITDLIVVAPGLLFIMSGTTKTEHKHSKLWRSFNKYLAIFNGHGELSNDKQICISWTMEVTFYKCSQKTE